MKKAKVCIHLHVHIHPQTDETKSLSQSKHSKIPIPNQSFYLFVEQEIKHAHMAGQHSTARNYQTALNSFRLFCHSNIISFKDITSKLTSAYEQWLKQRGVCLNTISCYMRSLRSVYNKAIEQGLIEAKQPFRKVYTGVERTTKRGIDKTSIRKLQELPLQIGTPHFLARDLFIFSLSACGMPFVDMAYLKKSQIKNGYISYYRHKTGKQIHIKIENCMQQIIERYQNSPTEYLFPIIHSSQPQAAYRNYRTGVGYYNRLLKQLAKQSHISENLTSYVTRHSWASFAYEDNVELPIISKALGHTLPQTTLIYIKDINDAALEKANHKIISKLQLNQ